VASVVEPYELDEHERALLVEAVGTVDLLADLDAAVRRDGALVDSPQGTKAHPAPGRRRGRRGTGTSAAAPGGGPRRLWHPRDSLVRRRKEELPAPVGTVPPELLVGKVTEVWAEDGRHLLSAFHRWTAARTDWEAQSGLTPYEANRLMPGGSPWSAQYLIEAGREDEVHDMLARRGATLDQLEELRRRAQRWDRP